MKTTMSKQILFLAAFCCMAMSAVAQTVDMHLATPQSYTINNTADAVSGTAAAVTYRWLENGTPISGATAVNYTIPANKSAGIYTYIRQANSKECIEWQNSNAFTVQIDCGVRIENTIWACSNVDEFGTFATAPDADGKLYQFNRTTAYTPRVEADSWTITAIDENSDWTTANSPCPDGWQLATFAQITELKNKGYAYRDATSTGYSAAGAYLGCPDAASATQSDHKGCIFVPATGGLSPEGAVYATHWAVTWLRTQSSYTTARVCYYDHVGIYETATRTKAHAFPIRCVKI
ncbi:MAG: hypothetical protein LBD52_08860 [Prevotellaceae bacterium]|jgi:hypothetical protein|nr:hypothetical protein [Prevotellaceae bacterium]